MEAAFAHAAQGTPLPARESEKPRRRGLAGLLPSGGLFPWWSVILLAIYVLLKLYISMEHPCSILGTSTVTRGAVSKAYRSVSTCTHPDKLRDLSETERQRGELPIERVAIA